MLVALRVLAVGNMYPPHHLGGYELLWHSAMEHLRGRGHELRVLTTDFALDEPDASIPEADYVDRALRWYWEDHRFPRVGPLARRRLERHNARVFDAAVEDFGPAAVTWWAMGGMSLGLLKRGRRRGLPSLAVVIDDWPLYAPRVDGPLDPGAVDAWSFCSEVQYGRVRAAVGGAHGTIDRPGADLGLFHESPPGEWAWRLLYCGRLDERKGVDLCVAALPHLPEASLTVVGGGDPAYRDELAALAVRAGVSDRVRFERASRAELPGAYAAADAVLFPVRWEEPWGLVPLEAMAVGRPVVASGRGGSGEYLEDGVNCLIADPDEGPSAIAAALERLAADPELRETLREGGRRTAERFSRDAFDEAIADRVEALAAAR
jgi:glycosyltransferase involved in cell wall biosynthesis